MRVLVGSVLVASMVLTSAVAVRAATLDPAGTWLTQDGRAKIRTEHCGEGGGKLCGFVVWMKNPVDENGQPFRDIKNPDPAKRNRPSLGLELMNDLSKDDETHYTGEIYNADNGKMYDVKVSIETPEELQIYGCMLKFLCGSQTWTRVADLPIPGGAMAKSAGTTTVAKIGKSNLPGQKHDAQPSH